MSVGNEFQRQALATHVAQRMAGPAQAILGFQELLLEQARDLGLNHMLADLERIGAAATQLNGFIDRLIDDKANCPAEDAAEADARLRHDLRTPLNAIIGYSEMILEEAAELQPHTLKEDLGVILAAAAELLKQVEAIAGLSHGGAIEALQPRDQGGLDAAELERVLFRTEQDAWPDQGGRILVVDDVASNRDLLSRRLRREGHRVVTADSGLSALARLTEQEFDLLLLDILMPDMNGIEVLSRLKADDRWRHVPVIMISGLNEVAAVARCIEAGADEYLTKPFNPILLRARINSTLEKKRWLDREHRYLERIETEKRRADSLIHAILPDQIVARLQGGEEIIADRFDEVSILFADIVGFSPIAARLPPTDLVRRLDRMFSTFDLLTEQHRVEKIKTIGDAYMAACGIPEPSADHADRIVALAKSMLESLRDTADDGERFRVRIGIHSGPVVAGLIGRLRFVYDVWGETVNIASRLESQGVPDCVQISEATRRALRGRWALEPRCVLDLKGIGRTETYLVR
ncbi:adenylate/guanylate cyclase domain-containing protein [Sinorhizobium fredii]|uniref:histidine kinase n=2 Tax=Rhizobium fredii TaxID=380 RepID=A0A2A6M0T7_RHIFR|nr:adenylate/guanylate cyclase domain-containing protein [Sinorhizobium fredii]MCG5477013.1 response regulator [Sinorhizobium fredii]MQX08815.1 response regulator [Sinorhizobium fredii]PDT48381.1 adenylate cyclase [Sinorhizobium fredii]CCE98105.1 putative adenylate/guanylate cyclase [Sinorhizobium fredii HH103]GEC34394.1 adenylate cyclase [Sinorhizobium fredii]